MKMRNKGKVHPSPSASFSATSKDALSVLKLLPAAILTLASLLPLQDKEVLAYMITRSLKTTINPSNILQEKSKKPSTPNSKTNKILPHSPPMFDCECFSCYTSYWAKWNSSPNRELIHQAIEAFEEHLSSTNDGESSPSSSKNKGKSKKREKMGRRGTEKIQENASKNQESLPEIVVEAVVAPPVSAVAGCSSSSHKGLARKVLPDLLGLFNSRLWSLWGPNV